ncbi:MAG: alkaline phosphatase D [Planctomycetota bacterium]
MHFTARGCLSTIGFNLRRISHAHIVLIAVFSLLILRNQAWAQTATTSKNDSPDRPNIVFIISDDHDYEHFGFVGHPLLKTPAIDALANSGTVFTTAHLPMSRCRPTLASMLSGLHPHQSGIYYNYGQKSLSPVNTLPSLLKEKGYATFGAGKFWEGDARRMGFTHGDGKTPNRLVRKHQDDVFEFIDDVGGKQPFFIWWAPKIPHAPHNPPKHLMDQFDENKIQVPDWYQGPKRRYRKKEHKLLAMTSWLDEGVNALTQKIKDKKLEKNTLFVFLIDNGWANGLPSKGSAFEKGLRTPIIMKWPGHVPANQRINALVSTLDLFPTLLNYAGAKVPNGLPGKDLRELISGKKATIHESVSGVIYPAFATKDDECPERDAFAIYTRDQRFKYVRYLQDVEQERNGKYLRIQNILCDYPTRQAGDEDLFDLANDPLEMKNLANDSEQANRLTALRLQTMRWWKETGGKPFRTAPVESTKSTPPESKPQGTGSQKKKPQRPNIVYIFADDLGYGEVGCYGQKKISTPCIDQLAQEGMRFTQHYSGSPVCAPSRCTLMTGQHTGHTYVRDNKGKPVVGQLPIPANTVTIGSVLQRTGYRTGIVGKWGLGGPQTTGLPNKQGFDFFYGYLDQWRAHSYYPDYLWRNNEKEEIPGNLGGNQGTYSHDLVTNEALKFISEAKPEKPFFLCVAYTVPHVSLHVPEDSLKPYLGKWEETPYPGAHYAGHPTPRAAYAAMITRMDRDVGKIMEQLKAQGLDDDTLVIFSSDNGPTYTGGVDHKFFQSAGPLRGLKGSLYEGGIRVPMIARWPQKIQPDTTSDLISACWDMFPTFADLAGADVPDDIDGISILPTLVGESDEQPSREYLYWEYRSRNQAVRLGDWKAYRPNPEAKIELYNLEADIAESTDVAQQNPDVVSKIAKIMVDGRTSSEHFPLQSKPKRTRRTQKEARLFPITGLIVRDDWKLVAADSESRFNGKLGQLAFDNNIKTIWHTEWRDKKPDHPHHLVIDMGREQVASGIRYLARQDGGNGMVDRFEIYLSNSQEDFGEPIFGGQFARSSKVQEKSFKKSRGRFLKFRTLSAHGAQLFASVAEIGLMQASTSNAIKSPSPKPKPKPDKGDQETGSTRRWLGSDYWGNRLQDWQLREGRIECTDRLARPRRTVHHLTRKMTETEGDFEVSVELGSVNPTRELEGDSAAGFLIGAANSLVHNWQSLGFGLFCGIDGNGSLTFGEVNNSEEAAGASKGNWTKKDRYLKLVGRHQGDSSYELELTLFDSTSMKPIARKAMQVKAHRLVGNIALLSHSGSRAKAKPLGADRFWFRNWKISGKKTDFDATRAVGPIVSSQYTLSQNVLKLTAQLMPIGTDDPQSAELQIRQAKEWQTVARSDVVYPGFTAPFRVANWDATQDTDFRVKYGKDFWQGTIRQDPTEKDPLIVAGFTGNHNNSHRIGRKDFDWGSGIWFPHADLVERINLHNPDVLFFSGDQLYEGKSPTFADRENIELDYLYKWYLWCWAYRDLTKNRPTVTLPDDHDVFQGNVWGQGGRQAKSQNGGGYVHGGEFIHLVENTQTSHLPDAFDPRPIEQEIPVRFSNMVYGRVSFAILEDRKFKTGCAGNGLPDTGTKREDHFNNPDFDVRLLDKPGLELLGTRQLKFLRHWAGNWTGADMKIALSQTIFANMATHHGPELTHLIADLDSNGWPQSGRNRAISELRRGFAMHLAGDQHLATVVHHGVDHHDDAIWSFCVPSIANFYPRAWSPKNTGAYVVPEESEFKGRHVDGFKNLVTVHAATNPGLEMGHEPKDLHDNMPGYGIVRINKKKRQYQIECWPRYAIPGQDNQYPGWPMTISQQDNYARKPTGYLPMMTITGMNNPVLRIFDESGVLVYAYRLEKKQIRPPVFADGNYTVEIGEPGTPHLWRRTINTSSKDQIAVLIP